MKELSDAIAFAIEKAGNGFIVNFTSKESAQIFVAQTHTELGDFLKDFLGVKKKAPPPPPPPKKAAGHIPPSLPEFPDDEDL